jgi:hypothetical protein
MQFEVLIGSKLKYVHPAFFLFSSLQLKKTYGKYLISEDPGGIRCHAKTKLLKFQEYLHITSERRWI